MSLNEIRMGTQYLYEILKSAHRSQVRPDVILFRIGTSSQLLQEPVARFCQEPIQVTIYKLQHKRMFFYARHLFGHRIGAVRNVHPG